MIRPAIRIMAHPSRTERARVLAASLHGRAVIDWDDAPSALRGHVTALNSWVPKRATHIVVLQDDARPCEGFQEILPRCLAARPEALVAFYYGSMRIDRQQYLDASWRCEHWHPLPVLHFVPTVALAWPIDHAASFVAWAQEPLERGVTLDDEMVKMWRRYSGAEAWATIPSLVRHTNDLPSTIGHAQHGHRDALCAAGKGWQGVPISEIRW